ncbi:hypothetical protein, partial [Roseovarius sp. D22-M7]|uniref:hypothetical protein n=1 Tax=Roseovarius sp. D22-M7 TaxID=3127116 RepID=UPI00300FA61A
MSMPKFPASRTCPSGEAVANVRDPTVQPFAQTSNQDPHHNGETSSATKPLSNTYDGLYSGPTLSSIDEKPGFGITVSASWAPRAFQLDVWKFQGRSSSIRFFGWPA